MSRSGFVILTAGATLLRKKLCTAGVGSTAPRSSTARISKDGLTISELPVKTVNSESVQRPGSPHGTRCQGGSCGAGGGYTNRMSYATTEPSTSLPNQ